jgi:hypothetical protein
LLEEEMRRITQYLRWQANWWTTRVGLRDDKIDDKQREGDRAYALRQAALKEALAANFAAKWEPLAAMVARARAEEEVTSGDSVRAGDTFEADEDGDEDVGSEGEEAWPVPAHSKRGVRVDLVNE